MPSTYESNLRWAAKAGRRSVQLWLPEDVIASLDEAAAKLPQVEDSVTGRKRKPGRADLLTQWVRTGSSTWRDILETQNGTIDILDGLVEDYRQRVEELEAEIESMTTGARDLADHADRLQGALDEARAMAERELAAHRAQFEKDLAACRERSEKDLAALRRLLDAYHRQMAEAGLSLRSSSNPLSRN